MGLGSFIKGALGGSALAPLVGTGAGLLDTAVTAKGVRDSNQSSERIARENRIFQERMSSTAVQRRMEDMKSAGINPILAGKYDASTPAGSVAQMSNPFPSGAGVSTALANMRSMAEIKNIDAQAEYVRNKGDVIKPLSDVGETLGTATTEAAKDIKSVIKPGYQSFKNVLLDSIKSVGTSAKAVKRKSDQVGHTYKSWWKSLTNDFDKFKKAYKTWSKE